MPALNTRSPRAMALRCSAAAHSALLWADRLSLGGHDQLWRQSLLGGSQAQLLSQQYLSTFTDDTDKNWLNIRTLLVIKACSNSNILCRLLMPSLLGPLLFSLASPLEDDYSCHILVLPCIAYDKQLTCNHARACQEGGCSKQADAQMRGAYGPGAVWFPPPRRSHSASSPHYPWKTCTLYMH